MPSGHETDRAYSTAPVPRPTWNPQETFSCQTSLFNY